MDEAAQAQFLAITGASATTAAQYLQFAEENLEAAIELYYANDGAPLEAPAQAQPPPVPPPSTRPSGHRPPESPREGPITIDSDDDFIPDDDDVQFTGSNSKEGRGSSRTPAASQTPPVATSSQGVGASALEDDEAMARRLQEEIYGSVPGGSTNAQSEAVDADGYRQHLQRTTEPLIGPEG